MNQDLFDIYYESRSKLAIIVNFDRNFTDDPVKRNSNIIVLVRSLDEYTTIKDLETVKKLIEISNGLNENEIYIQSSVKRYFGEKVRSKLLFVENSYITQETSLTDMKTYLATIISDFIKKPVYAPFLYIESTDTRKPIQNYVSGMNELDIDISDLQIGNVHGEEISIDDILLKNIESVNSVYCFNVYTINDYIDSLNRFKMDLIKTQEKKLSKLLHNFWTKLDSSEILKRLKTSEFDEGLLDTYEQHATDFMKLIKQESEYNDMFWKVKVKDDLFQNIGIYFNSFILENKTNKRDRTIDIYSVFKFFKLDDHIPFSRYSYGNHQSQKIVKIFETFYSIENINFLEKWSSGLNYKDTPANCVQWKGFYPYEESGKLEYEFILFNDCTYQVRFYQQRINLAHIELFLQFVSDTILTQIKQILYSIGITILLEKLELGKNIHFIFSKLEINVVLTKELEVGKLQNILNKSNFLFDRAGDLMSTEFINLEFKKVNNYTRADQIFKYINYFVTQNRITEISEMGPVIKQIVTKYNKNVIESTEIVQGWIRRFVDLSSQQNKKVRIGKNIGLDIVGKQLGSTICNFYMSNVIGLEDIYTFYYYLIVLLNWSQNTENNRLYAELLGRKTDEKILSKIQQQKDEEGEIDLLGDVDFDALVYDEDDNVEEEDLDDKMSVHSEASQESDDFDEKVDLPNEDDVFDELEPNVNGSSYYINRLKMMDKEVYGYTDKSFAQYSKKAQLNDSRQPIILSNRQMKKIIDKYKEDTNVYGGIKKDLAEYKEYTKPSYSIKYRNLHYICPKVWCMKDQMPYYMSSLKEKKASGALVDAKIGFNEKGEYLINPDQVVCPDCGNGVWNSKLDTGTLLIAQDNLKRQPYPGFFTGDQHPKNLCMVTCFKRPNQKVEECTADKPQVPKEKKVSNEKYILKGDKYGKCSYGRFCVLPERIHEWMNQDFGNFKNERSITDNYIGFLRKGILKDTDNYYESFEKSIKYLLGDDIFMKSSVDFRTYLVDKFKSIPEIEKKFRKCRKGSLYLYFGKNIDNYYQYIMDTISLQPRFILPLLSYPGVEKEKGINFFILREENKKILLECEYFDYSYDESRENANSMFMYMYQTGETYKKLYYEPIVRVQQRSKTIDIIRSLIGVSKNSLLDDLMKYVKIECVKHEDPLLTIAKKSFFTENDFFMDNKISSIQIVQTIAEDSNFQILMQYVNSYNQTEGIIINWKTDGLQYYIPFKPMDIMDDIKILKIQKKIRLQTYNKTFQMLTALNIEQYSPFFYTVNFDKQMITGIYTKSGIWIPTLYADKSESKLKEWNIPKDVWIQKILEADERTVYKQDKDTKKFNYEKLRFELSQAINTSEKLKQFILIKMREYKDTKDIIGKNRIREELIQELSDFLRETLVKPGIVGDWNIKDIFNYCNSNVTIQSCNKASMCRWSEEKSECRMIINPEWYWKFISRIVDEILVNVNKRKEIVEEYRKELELPENETIFYSKDELDSYLEGYDFNLENKKYMKHPLEHFNYTNPKQVMVNSLTEPLDIYHLPNYIKNLFNDVAGNSRLPMRNQLGVYFSSDKSPNYFFKSLDELTKVAFPEKKLFVSSRSTLALQIHNYSDSDLLDRYKSLSEMENGEIYRRFVTVQSIQELIEYVKVNSWGSLLDLELLSPYFNKKKIRFIIINDVGRINIKEPFIYLINHLKGLTGENIEEYKFVVWSNFRNRLNMIMKKDTKTPLFTYQEIPFIQKWLEGQIAFESSL